MKRLLQFYIGIENTISLQPHTKIDQLVPTYEYIPSNFNSIIPFW